MESRSQVELPDHVGLEFDVYLNGVPQQRGVDFDQEGRTLLFRHELAGEGKLGITVTAVPTSVLSKLGVKGGVMVSSVRPGSFADEINLTKGTIITEIDTEFFLVFGDCSLVHADTIHFRHWVDVVGR